MGPRLTNYRGTVVTYKNALFPPQVGGFVLFSTAEVYISFPAGYGAVQTSHGWPSQKVWLFHPRQDVDFQLPAWNPQLAGYANSSAIPAPASVTTAHHPNTTPMQVPRLTRVTHE